MKGLGDKEALGCGAVLAASDVDQAKRRRQALAIIPAQLTDPLTRAVLAIADDMLARGELPSAATVFVEGGSRNLFDTKDRERLREWQVNDTLTDGELVTIGRTLHREAQNRRVGDLLMALGAAVKSGKSKQGNPFGHSEARAWFDQIARDYEAAHASGITGPEAVAITRARAEERWARGQTAYVTTGMTAFDSLFGGFVRSLCWILGHAGKGKSTVISTLLALFARRGLKPTYFVTEDDVTAPVERHMALRMNMKRRDVYSKPFEDDVKAKEQEELLKLEWAEVRLYTKAHGTTIDDVLRLFTREVVEHDSQVFVLDNITGLVHALANRNDTVHAAASRAVQKAQDWAERWGRCLIVAAHTNNAYWERTQGKKPPDMPDTADTGGASNAARYVRFGLGVWQVGETLRATCIKNNAEGALEARKATIAWDAHVDQGLVDVDSGREVNLQQEAREQRETQAATTKRNKDAEAERVRNRNKQWALEEKAKREAAEAEAKAKEPAQGVLLDVENPKERA